MQIAIGKKPEKLKQTATEAVYGMARVDIGGGIGSAATAPSAPGPPRPSRRSAPSRRDVVGPYGGNRAKQWGRSGVPDDIKAKAGDHKVKTATLVQTYEELEDALANGYPVPVCSNQGFTLTRDADGLLPAAGASGATAC